MQPHDQWHYVPVLKWKQGEQRALKEIEATVKGALTPLLEMTFTPDHDTGNPAKPIEDLVEAAVGAIVDNWPRGRSFFLDAGMFAGVVGGAGRDGAAALFHEAAGLSLPFVPVVGLHRSAAELDAALGARSRGTCFRVSLDDFEAGSLAMTVDSFVKKHGLSLDDTDLVMDLGAFIEDRPGLMETLSRSFIAEVPSIEAWRSVTLVGSAFPASLAAVQTDGEMTVTRLEWLNWLRLRTLKSSRIPTFGDYGIQHPEGPENLDPRKITLSASIRYTLEKSWLIVKGRTQKASPFTEQFPALATRLRRDPRYMGVMHCRGCGDVDQASQGAPNLSALTVWRRIGTIHHITATVEQIAALRAS
jgi:hypothetical protein